MSEGVNQVVKGTEAGFERAVEAINSDFAINSLLVSMPILGPIIREFIGAKASKIVQRRLTELFTGIEAKIATIKDNELDKEFFETEEFFDLLSKAMKFSSETRHIEKIDLFANIVGNACRNGARVDYDPEWYLQIINELTVVEWQVAVGLYNLQAPHAGEYNEPYYWEKNHTWHDLDRIITIQKNDIKMILFRLQNCGLVVENSDLATTIDEGRHFLISPLLCKIIAWLQERSKPISTPLDSTNSW